MKYIETYYICMVYYTLYYAYVDTVDETTPVVVSSSITDSRGQPTTTLANVPSLSPTTAESSSNQPAFVLIVTSFISALLLLILFTLGLVLLLKYRQLRIGKRSTQLDNPTYQGER